MSKKWKCKNVLALSVLGASLLVDEFSPNEAYAGEFIDAVNEERSFNFDPQAVEIEMGKSEAYFITQDGALFGLGSNSAPRYRREQHYYPGNPKPPRGTIVPLRGNVHQMDDNILVTTNGEVYVWVDDKLRGSHYDDNAYHPFSPMTKVEGVPDRVVEVAKASHTAFALTSDGKVYGWGSNHHGALLLGEDHELRSDTPIELNFPEEIKKIVVENGDKGFAIGVSGSVYIWGSTAPLDNKADYPYYLDETAAKIPFEEGVRIKDVTAFARTALYLSEDGKVYATGRHGNKLGMTKEIESLSVSVPTVIPTLANENVIDIAINSQAGFAVTEDGKVFSWGNNNYGALGRGIDDESYVNGIPTQMEDLPPIQSVDADNHSGEGSIAVDRTGKIWVWGHSKYYVVDGSQYDGHLISPTKITDITNLRREYAEKYALLDGFDLEKVEQDWGQNGINEFMKYFKWEWINPDTDTGAIMSDFNDWMQSQNQTQPDIIHSLKARESSKISVEWKDNRVVLKPLSSASGLTLNHSQQVGDTVFLSYGMTANGNDALIEEEIAGQIEKIIVLHDDKPYHYMDNRTNTPKDKDWTIEFNTAIDQESITDHNVVVTDEFGNTVATDVTTSTDAKNIHLTPPIGEYNNGVYTLTINESVAAKSGTTLQKPVRMVFIVE